jgi:hypothetical protein
VALTLRPDGLAPGNCLWLNPNDTAGLRALPAEVGRKWIRGIVLYTGLEVIPFANNLHGVPLQALWQPIG